MKRIIFACLSIVCAISTSALAAKYVRGHMRSDGNYVQPHYRGISSDTPSDTNDSQRNKGNKKKKRFDAKNNFKPKRECPSPRLSSGACPDFIGDRGKRLKKSKAKQPIDVRPQIEQAAPPNAAMPEAAPQ